LQWLRRVPTGLPCRSDWNQTPRTGAGRCLRQRCRITFQAR
jgi:hypothetical protein